MWQREKNKAVILFEAEESEKEHEANEIYRRLWEYAQEHEMSIVGSFAAAKGEFFLAFSHAIKACSKNDATILLLDTLLSFQFSYKELSAALKMIADTTITLMVDGFCLDPKTSSVFLSMLNAAAKVEKEQHSSRIKNSLQLLSKKGKSLGARKYGSVPEEARIIRQIIGLNKQGKSLDEICRLLENNNIKTTQDKRWYPTTIKRLIDRHKKN